MTNKNIRNIGLLSTFVILSSLAFGNTNVFAEESSGYKMVGDVIPVLTFTFRDGIETHEFPVFEMGENFVTNSGATFSVEGTVNNSPLLHKALDEAYKYRLVSGNSHEFQYKYFDVDVDFVKDTESIFTLDYNNCKIDNYQIETLDSNDYESYFKEVGFAIVDKIDFECSGVNYDNNIEVKSTTTSFTDYGESGFNFANDMRTSVTFSFDGGVETIEFPFFELVSGYKEESEIVTAEFRVEGILDYYPLLYKAIDDSRLVSGIGSGSNTDFEALVEFTNGETVLRGFDFRDCRVSNAEVTTQTDKEEGFTGKSGFAVVHRLAFACSGFEPINMYYDELEGDIPIWRISDLSNVYEEPIQNSDKGLKAVASFTYPTGVEIIEFTMFTQKNVLTSTEDVNIERGDHPIPDSFDRKTTYPTFELRGIVGDYPMLYNAVDENRKIHGVSGTQMRELFDVDINIENGDEIIRGFNYSNCRTMDYVVATEPNKEESYVKNKFALENIFDFECQGYHPNNPVYDAMFDEYVETTTLSTNDLISTDRWGPGFYVQ